MEKQESRNELPEEDILSEERIEEIAGLKEKWEEENKKKLFEQIDEGKMTDEQAAEAIGISPREWKNFLAGLV